MIDLDPKSAADSAPSRPTEGRFAIVTNAGRDAVDALALQDEKRVKRTAKSCGPDAPTLASSVRRRLRRRRWQKSPVTGESAKKTVKTIARGMPGVSGVTVVTNARAFYTPRAAAGASSARHSLRPLIFRRRDILGYNSDAICAAGSRSCIQPSLPATNAKLCARERLVRRSSTSEGERRRSNPRFRACCCMDCFAYARNDAFGDDTAPPFDKRSCRIAGNVTIISL
jgi:hypothetical protein